ncbi:DUF2946 domain-containing protein [Candidatus Pantoea persica]|uniref:DUF2946 domain-containing protein n=1 Tax=Candidatus Pantoea persica TaxID=2518128 RepID=UPI00215D8FA9|nr:DUF2946 domain-containing protein [Candidatus Pantoea persica]MBA2813948.1 hypothetical protein [Candidatus Pantoea persica]
MTLFTPMQKRLSACLAILAVLLLFVAPVVSQELMARQSSAMRAAMLHHAMPVAHHRDAATSHDAMSMANAAMMPPGHMMDLSGFACGYCKLLVHVPLMIWAAVPLIWLTMIVSRAPPPLRAVSPPRRRERRIYRPRAPPCRCRA